MSRKKLFALIIASALVLAASITGTLMYFTAESPEATNVVTMGGLSVSMTEIGENDEEITIQADGEGLNYDNVEPGAILVKQPKVKTGEDDIDSYIRVKFSLSWWKLVEGDEVSIPDEEIPSKDAVNALIEESFSVNENWIYVAEDGYFYYVEVSEDEDAPAELKILSGGAETSAIFEDFTIPSDLSNEFKDKILHINLKAEAVQSNGNVAPDGEEYELKDYFKDFYPTEAP
ncbi:MAG: hypothetical protein LBU32_07375 [Clostridiales bacterium]|jgi:hypothetical protein|nr:hypothetical protein [Clostridiales bacterium]